MNKNANNSISLSEREFNILKYQKITHKYECVSMWQLVFDDLDNSHNASTDLFSSVTMVVGPYPQYYNLKERLKRKKKIKQCLSEKRMVAWDQHILSQSKDNETTV